MNQLKIPLGGSPPKSINQKQVNDFNIVNKLKEVENSALKDMVPLSSLSSVLNTTIKGIFYYTYTFIEKELGIKRLGQLAEYMHDIAIKCGTCRIKKAKLECIDCQERYCTKCLQDYHDLEFKVPHRVENLQHLNIQTQSTICETLKSLKEVHNQKDQKGKKAKEAAVKEKMSTYTPTDWVKMEYFSFPVYKNSESYFLLEKVYKILYEIYIHENSISADNTIEDIEKALKFKAVPKGHNLNSPYFKTPQDDNDEDSPGPSKPMKGKVFERNRVTDMGITDCYGLDKLIDFIELSDFNNEEKILLNKIAFVVFKKRGAKAKFDDFFRQIKIIEVSIYTINTY